MIPLHAVLGIALAASTAVPAAASADGSYVLALDQQPSGRLDVNIDIRISWRWSTTYDRQLNLNLTPSTESRPLSNS